MAYVWGEDPIAYHVGIVLYPFGTHGSLVGVPTVDVYTDCKHSIQHITITSINWVMGYCEKSSVDTPL
mgnify:CR=1 FL=1